MNHLLKAKEIIANSLNISVQAIPDNASLSDIEQIDSLTFEKIVLNLEKELGQTIDSIELLEVRNIQDLANILAQKKKS